MTSPDTKSDCRFAFAPCATADALALERQLGVRPATAQVLVRRGYADPVDARRFLAAEERHPPEAFGGLAAAAELIATHVRRGSRVTVHGDYDCDGVCSTAILVECLRALGADVDWYLPDRATDGYGLAAATVERLASRGTELLITADCAITAAEEVALARRMGLEVVVTDHHRPRADGCLPDAPIVHPAVGGYPCRDLCATAVAAKLAEALRERHGCSSAQADRADLELVALATVADVVPLLGENRRLVREGIRALAGTSRPGLRALMAVARVDAGSLDERDLGFRLTPRINAAGRLYRPDLALELLTTRDPDRAAALAAELDRANAERRHTETRILFEAERLLTEQMPDGGPVPPAIVLAGPGWHPGVIGIVASRIAERHHRPTVLIALPSDGAGNGRGSGRSIAAFDLLGGLDAAGGHLVRHGGHRAAAGLEISPDAVDAFREAFVGHAASLLAPEDLVPVERVDAVVSGDELDLGLAEELRRLGPFGAGNPGVTLLAPAAQLSQPSGFGGEQRRDHVRFSVLSGGARSRAVAFGSGGRLPCEADQPVDATFRLERNEWNGVVEPRLILRRARPCEPPPIELLGEDGPYLQRAFTQLDAPPAASVSLGTQERELRDRRGRGIAATIAALVASGEPVLVACADAHARLVHLRARLGGFGLCSFAALARDPSLARERDHLVVLDPPSSIAHVTACKVGLRGQMVHLAWGEAELRFAQHIHEQEFALRASLADVYRTLRDRGGAAGGELEAVLRGAGRRPRSPELAGRLLRVLVELDLIGLDREAGAATVLPRPRTELERSLAFRAYERQLEDGRRFLESNKAQAA